MKPYEYVVNEIRLGPVAKMINDYPTHYLCLFKKKNRNISHYEHEQFLFFVVTTQWTNQFSPIYALTSTNANWRCFIVYGDGIVSGY